MIFANFNKRNSLIALTALSSLGILSACDNYNTKDPHNQNIVAEAAPLRTVKIAEDPAVVPPAKKISPWTQDEYDEANGFYSTITYNNRVVFDENVAGQKAEELLQKGTNLNSVKEDYDYFASLSLFSGEEAVLMAEGLTKSGAKLDRYFKYVDNVNKMADKNGVKFYPGKAAYVKALSMAVKNDALYDLDAARAFFKSLKKCPDRYWINPLRFWDKCDGPVFTDDEIEQLVQRLVAFNRSVDVFRNAHGFFYTLKDQTGNRNLFDDRETVELAFRALEQSNFDTNRIKAEIGKQGAQPEKMSISDLDRTFKSLNINIDINSAKKDAHLPVEEWRLLNWDHGSLERAEKFAEDLAHLCDPNVGSCPENSLAMFDWIKNVGSSGYDLLRYEWQNYHFWKRDEGQKAR